MDSFCPNGDCAGGSTNQNPSGGGGFPSLVGWFIGLFQDLFGGGSARPTPPKQDYLGKRHMPEVVLVGTEEDIGTDQHNMEPLPGGLVLVQLPGHPRNKPPVPHL